jgi:hypothetical protein
MLAGAPSVAASEIDAACDVPLAIPDDGQDDRGAIQNALTAQGCAHLGAGVYDIETIQVAPPGRRPPMMLDAIGAELFGDGPATVLAFRGSAGDQDWEGVAMRGAGPKLHDLSIVTGAVTDTVEQMHAVRIVGPATDAEIARVSFNHPIRVGEKSGDCVQLIGFSGSREIARVTIRENDFAHCDRSGVAVHSGTTGLEIADNQFRDTGNQDVDFEGTGDTSGVLIQRNTFTLSPGPHGAGAIQLQLADGVRVTNNLLNGRGIDVFQSDDVMIDHNEVTLTQTTAESAIAVGKDSARTHILANSVTRAASAGPGPVISAGPHGSGTPDHLEIDGNTLLQRTSSNIVLSTGLVGLYLRHNTLTYSGAETDVMWGLRALGSAGGSGAPGIRTTDVRVEGNTFSGPLRGAVATSGANAGAGTLDTADNVATGPTFGIFCDNFASQGAVLGPITSRRDNWPAALCGPADFVKVIVDEPDDPPPPSRDTTAPVLSGVSLSRARFRIGKGATAIAARARRGTMLRFSSSEAGTLSVQVDLLRRGKKPARIATLTRAIGAGPGSVALSGRIGARRMKPGSYRLTLTARDAAGNSSQATRRTFTVLAG